MTNTALRTTKLQNKYFSKKELLTDQSNLLTHKILGIQDYNTYEASEDKSVLA